MQLIECHAAEERPSSSQGHAWSVQLKLSRPALRRTTERGMSTRAAATQRITSSGPGGAMPASGVPATATCTRGSLSSA